MITTTNEIASMFEKNKMHDVDVYISEEGYLYHVIAIMPLSNNLYIKYDRITSRGNSAQDGVDEELLELNDIACTYNENKNEALQERNEASESEFYKWQRQLVGAKQALREFFKERGGIAYQALEALFEDNEPVFINSTLKELGYTPEYLINPTQVDLIKMLVKDNRITYAGVTYNMATAISAKVTDNAITIKFPSEEIVIWANHPLHNVIKEFYIK